MESERGHLPADMMPRATSTLLSDPRNMWVEEKNSIPSDPRPNAHALTKTKCEDSDGTHRRERKSEWDGERCLVFNRY